MPNVYVKHPVSKELKAKVNLVYPEYGIIDLKYKDEYMTDGDIIYDVDNPPERKIVKPRNKKPLN